MSDAKTPSKSAVDEDFIISRTFDAPKDLVWKAWTQREALMQWFGHKGCTMTHATLDFSPGGVCHYCLKLDNGGEMWGKFVYREIIPTQRIVWVHSFSDKDGNLTRHPFMPTWPSELLTVVTFEDHDGKTTVTLRWTPIEPTAVERDTFNSNRAGATMGWNSALDQLAEYLHKQ